MNINVNNTKVRNNASKISSSTSSPSNDTPLDVKDANKQKLSSVEKANNNNLFLAVPP